MNASVLLLSVVVLAAHHDDELLWFEPWLEHASEVVILMPTTKAYDAPRSLEEREYGTKVRSLWGRTTDEDYLTYWLDKDLRPQSLNYRSVKQLLRGHFQKPSNTTFVTHNPWGEYGHVNHRLMYAAARDLALEYKKTLLVDTIHYSGTYTFPETRTSQSFPYNLARVSAIRTAFQTSILRGTRSDLWTWGDAEEDIPGFHQSVPYSQVIVDGVPVDLEELERYAEENPLPMIGAAL